MVPHRRSLLRLAPLVLLVGVGSCSHFKTRPSLAQREAACAPVWKAAHADIDARGASCTADWECQLIRPEYLGCEAWASVGFSLTEARLLELESACAPVSFVPDCGERVGACLSGRCTGRPAVRDATACTAAKEHLHAPRQLPAAGKGPEPISCRKNTDCPEVDAFGDRTTGLAVEAPREWHAVLDACPVPDGFLVRAGPHPASVSRCIDRTCLLEPKGAEGHPLLASFSKAAFVDQKCVGKGFQLPSTIAGAHGRMTISFRVSPRGIPYAFEFEGTRRRELMFGLAEAVSNCALIPAHRGEVPLDIRMSLPIIFARE